MRGPRLTCFSFFFFNDTATTEIYTLSLHDALPISGMREELHDLRSDLLALAPTRLGGGDAKDRKSTRLNSSHQIISYAVFCLKKKKTKTTTHIISRTQRRQLEHKLPRTGGRAASSD